MSDQEIKSTYCQSCGLPVNKPEDFGKNADGSRNKDYCHFCFFNGKFTAPDITMEQMIDKVTASMVAKKQIPEKHAGFLARVLIPQLKRWRK